MQDALAYVLQQTTDLPPLESMAAWRARHGALTRAFATTIDRAIAGGFAADRVGYAFASGYQSAGVALVTSAVGLAGLSPDRLVALCATEQGGAHPRAIATALVPASNGNWTLTGHKRWATFGADAETLLVVASAGTDSAGRNRLHLVRVDLPAPGLTVTPMPPPPFAPEVIHAEVTLAGVPVRATDVLPGDGYENYLKPFRTVEDTHVHGALLGYLARVGRHHGFPPALLERLAALLVTVRALGVEDPRSPAVHVALAGAIQGARAWIDESAPHWANVDADTRARWERDRPLLAIAENARTQRTARAWETLAQPNAAKPSA